MAIEETEELGSAALLGILRDPLGVLRRRWIWMALTLAAGLIATGGFAWRMHPTYVAEATVVVASQQVKEDFVRSTLQEDSLQRVNALVGEVLARDRLAELIEKHGLYPFERGLVAAGELAARMRRAISIRSESGIGQPSRYESAQLFAIAFEYEEPVAAAEVVNDLARNFTSEGLQVRSKQARLTTEFLRRELEGAERALRDQSREITEFTEQHRGELPSELDANLAKLDRLQQQRQSLALQIAESETRLATLSSQMRPGEVVLTPEARLQALRARLSEQLGLSTERHPEVISLRRQIESLEAELASGPTQGAGGAARGLASPVSTARRTLEELKGQRVSTEEAIRELDARVSRTPAHQEELAALQERETVLRESYLEFMRKVKDAELAESLEKAQQGARVSVLDWAAPPGAPTRARSKYLLLGLAASLAAAIGVGILLETVDPVLVTADQIEAESELPVLGSAPEIG